MKNFGITGRNRKILEINASKITDTPAQTVANRKMAAKLSSKLAGLLVIVILCTGQFVGALGQSKSIDSMKRLSEKQWLAMLKEGCVDITYNGPNKVATLCPVSTPPVTPPTPPTPPPPPPVDPTGKPSEVVGRLWTVMFPTGSQGDPDNLYISKAEADSHYTPYLYMKNGGVAFFANAGGTHSPNSKYPRSELREMTNETWGSAKWSNKTGSHTIEGTYSITHDLVKRKQVVFVQAHDGSDDIFQGALNDNQLIVQYNDKSSSFVLDANYVQGTQFSVKIVAQSGKFDVYFNGVLKGTVPKSTTSGFWKSGSYLQSNVADWGEAPSAGAEVIIYSLKVQ